MALTDWIRTSPGRSNTRTGSNTGVSTGPVDTIELKRDVNVPCVADHVCLIVVTDKSGKPRAVTFNGRGLPFITTPGDEKTVKALLEHWYAIGLQGTITSIKVLAPRFFGGSKP